MKRYKLLFVEDALETRKNITEYITNNYDNIDVYEATNGQEGWDKYSNFRPDILITDLSMDKICGLDLIEKIRKENQDIFIIVITAHGEQEKLLRAIKYNLVEYILKPLNRAQLKNSINVILKKLKDSDEKLFFLKKNIYFNHNDSTLYVDDEKISLTKSESKLLEYLISNKNQAIHAIDIFNYIWEFDKEYSINSVRTLVKKLRKKLPNIVIENIYGGSYKLVV